MQNQFLHLAKKYATTTPKIISFPLPYISSFILQQDLHILYWRCRSISDFMQSLYDYFNKLPAKKEGYSPERFGIKSNIESKGDPVIPFKVQKSIFLLDSNNSTDIRID